MTLAATSGDMRRMGVIDIGTFRSPEIAAIVSIWNRTLRRDLMSTARFVPWLFGDLNYWPGDDSGFFVARSAGKPVGFARAVIRRTHNERLGLEADKGWLPVIAVDPSHQRQGLGKALVARALEWLASHDRKEIWISGGSGSAPGYVFPGVDVDTYADGLQLLMKHAGFAIDHHAVSMSASTLDFDLDRHAAAAWEVGQEIVIEPLSVDRLQDFLLFMASEFPGDWITAARGKINAGRLGEVLIARRDDEVVGYCQWEGEHFGPIGVAKRERNVRVGAKLFVDAVRQIRAADGRTVWFNWADPEAQRFYERFGLTPTRRFAILRRTL